MTEQLTENEKLGALVDRALARASYIPKALQRAFGDSQPEDCLAAQEALASMLLARLHKCSFDEARSKMPIDEKLALLGLFTTWAPKREHYELMRETVALLHRCGKDNKGKR